MRISGQNGPSSIKIVLYLKGLIVCINDTVVYGKMVYFGNVRYGSRVNGSMGSMSDSNAILA